MDKLKRLVISCGGTGGHFNPGLSIAREFQELGGKPILLLGGKHAEKQAELAAKYQIESRKISAVSIPHNPIKMPGFLYHTWNGVGQCRDLFRSFDPQAILAMGSFASLPPAIAAHLHGLPLFLHDGNARIGKANRFLSRFAKAMALSFPAANAETSHCPTILTGMPIRPDILRSKLTKQEAVSRINAAFQTGFEPEKPIVLVFGGSLGAASINKNFKPSVHIPGIEQLQVIHLSGPGKYEDLKTHYKDAPCRVLVVESTQEMQMLYSAADLIVSRSGGSSVSEIAFFGKYAVLIPYPYAAELHQDDNALWLKQAGGARILKDSECSPEQFVRILGLFLGNQEEYRKKGEASKEIAMPRASVNVLEMIENILFSENAGLRAE